MRSWVLLAKRWVQVQYDPWFNLGIHVDHKAPYIAIHLPLLLITIGNLKPEICDVYSVGSTAWLFLQRPRTKGKGRPLAQPPLSSTGQVGDPPDNSNDEHATRRGVAQVVVAVILLSGATAHAHECPCPPGCVPNPSPAPTALPSPAPTAAPAVKCPPGTPKLNLGTSMVKVIPGGGRLIYCTQVALATPPSRIRFEFYELQDQDCGNLRLTVKQLAGAKQIKTSGPASNGSVAFVKRIGQSEDPARVANGDYLIELEGFPTSCTSYEIRAGAL